MTPHENCDAVIGLRQDFEYLRKDVSDLKAIKGRVEQIEPISKSVEALTKGREEDQRLLTQIQIEQQVQGSKLDTVSKLLTKHVDKAGDAFKTYGLPFILILVAAAAPYVFAAFK